LQYIIPAGKTTKKHNAAITTQK